MTYATLRLISRLIPTGSPAPALPPDRELVYNNAGRLYQVFENGVLKAGYVYNAAGQRTRKTTYQSDGMTPVAQIDSIQDDRQDKTADGMAAHRAPPVSAHRPFNDSPAGN